MVFQYDLIGESYVMAQRGYFSKREDEASQFLRASLGELHGKKVLDVGCGAGADFSMLKELGARIVGVDISKIMLDQANAGSAPLVLANMERLPFLPASFDALTSRFALHYLKGFDLAYQEFARILKPGGILCYISHHPLKDLLLQRVKSYGAQETVEINLYNGLVPISFPTHTLSDFLSQSFFKYFYLDDFLEEKSPEEYPDEFNSPGFIGIKAVKKS